MVVPDVLVSLTLLHRANRVFPLIDVVQAVTVRQTATGKPYECRFQGCNRFCDITTKSVFASFVGIDRKQGNHVYRHGSTLFEQQRERSRVGIRAATQYHLILLPRGGRSRERRVGHDSSLMILHHHVYRHAATVRIAEEHGKTIGFLLAQDDAVVSFVADAYAMLPHRFHVHQQIVGVVRMYRFTGFQRDGPDAVAFPGKLPGRERMPSACWLLMHVHVRRGIFKRTVLYQLRV